MACAYSIGITVGLALLLPLPLREGLHRRKEGGGISTAKAPTTPGELEKGVFDAVAVAAGTQGLGPEELLGRVTAFGHGTTQATNALIERTGATTGLIATRGFGDTLALQRLMGFTAGVPVENLGHYSRRRYPAPIVPRRLVREVRV